jgi:hypothetical protein
MAEADATKGACAHAAAPKPAEHKHNDQKNERV